MTEVGLLEGIVDCGFGNRKKNPCSLDGVEPHDHELSPRAQASKGNEMAVRRALELIEAFDELESDQDWTDVPGATYRRIIGNRYEYPSLLSECWKRYKDGTLYSQVWDLAQNLPDATLKKKELANGLDRISDRINS